MERIIPEGAYEMNALWNSIELAGMGMGSEFLIQVAMAAMPLIEAKHLVALTSPVTRRWREKHGWHLCSELGDEGYFVYPKDTLKATVEHYVHPDYEAHVAPEVLDLMTSIRRRPAGVTPMCRRQGSTQHPAEPDALMTARWHHRVLQRVLCGGVV